MRYFLRLGSSGFGCPIALVGYMQRDLVESRGWFSEEEYRQGLALARAMPGALAAQLAMWFGFLASGRSVPPLSRCRSCFRRACWSWPAAYKLARTTNKTDSLLWGIAAVVCAITAVAKTEIVWLFLSAGAFGVLYYGGGLPRWRPSGVTGISLLGSARRGEGVRVDGIHIRGAR